MKMSQKSPDVSGVQRLPMRRFRGGSHNSSAQLSQTNLKPSPVIVEHEADGHTPPGNGSTRSDNGKVPRPLAIVPNGCSSATSPNERLSSPRGHQINDKSGFVLVPSQSASQHRYATCDRCGPRFRLVTDGRTYQCLRCRYTRERANSDWHLLEAAVNNHSCASQLNGLNGEATNSDDVEDQADRKRRHKEAETHKHSKVADGKHRKVGNGICFKHLRGECKHEKCKYHHPDAETMRAIVAAVREPISVPSEHDLQKADVDRSNEIKGDTPASVVESPTIQQFTSASGPLPPYESLPRPSGVQAPRNEHILVERQLFYQLPDQRTSYLVLIMIGTLVSLTIIGCICGIAWLPYFLVTHFIGAYVLIRLRPWVYALYDGVLRIASGVPTTDFFGRVDARFHLNRRDTFSPLTGRVRYHYGRGYNASRNVMISTQAYACLQQRHPCVQPRQHTIQMLTATLVNEFKNTGISHDVFLNTASIYFQDMIRLEEERILMGVRRDMNVA